MYSSTAVALRPGAPDSYEFSVQNRSMMLHGEYLYRSQGMNVCGTVAVKESFRVVQVEASLLWKVLCSSCRKRNWPKTNQ